MNSVPWLDNEKLFNNWMQEGPFPIRRHVIQGRMNFNPKLKYKFIRDHYGEYIGHAGSKGNECGIGRKVCRSNCEIQEG